METSIQRRRLYTAGLAHFIWSRPKVSRSVRCPKLSPFVSCYPRPAQGARSRTSGYRLGSGSPGIPSGAPAWAIAGLGVEEGER